MAAGLGLDIGIGLDSRGILHGATDLLIRFPYLFNRVENGVAVDALLGDQLPHHQLHRCWVVAIGETTVERPAGSHELHHVIVLAERFYCSGQ